MAHFASADAYALYDDAKLVLGALVANRVPSVAASNSDSCARRILDSLGLGTYFADVYLNFSYEIGHTKLDRWFTARISGGTLMQRTHTTRGS